MVPSYFISIAKFTINVNGKVDRKALPLTDQQIITGVAFKEAETDAQKRIAAAFRKTLGLEKVSVNHISYIMDKQAQRVRVKTCGIVLIFQVKPE
jgi:hypothetical protein